MKKKPKRLLACLLAVALTITSVMGNGNIQVKAEEITKKVTSVWTKIALDQITEEDQIAITMATEDNVTYVLPSKTTSNNPSGEMTGTVEEDTLKVADHSSNYVWTIKKNNEGFTITNQENNYLSVISSNAARVNTTETIWNVDTTTNYLCTKVSEEVTRYLGINKDKSDFRAYTNIDNVIKNQSVSFYKYTNTVEEDAASEDKNNNVEDIEKLTPSIGTTNNLTAGATVKLQCGSLSDVQYEVKKKDSETWSEIDGDTYTIPNDEPGNYTLEFRGQKDEKYSGILEVSYTINDKYKSFATQITDLANLDTKYVYLYSVSDTVVMTRKASGKKLAASATATVTDQKLEVTDEMILLKAVKEENEGEYSFVTFDGKYLTSLETGNGLSFSETKTDYSIWEISATSEEGVNGFLIKNKSAVYKDKKQALEYYSGFTTYSEGTDKKYMFQFYQQDTEQDTMLISDARTITDETASVTTVGTVNFINKNNVSIQDKTGGINLYFDKAPADIKVGDIVKVTGTRSNFNGLEQIKTNENSCVILASGQSITCNETTIESLNTDYTGANVYESTSVRLSNVILGEINPTGNTVLTDGNHSINAFKQNFGDCATGDKVNLTATVSDYNGYQLINVTVTDVVQKASPENPEDPQDPQEPLKEVIEDGKYIIWNPQYNVTVSPLKNSSNYYIGETVTGDAKEVSGYTNSSLWNIKKLDSGLYLIEQNGMFLGTTDNKLVVSDTAQNKEWAITLKDGHYYFTCKEKYLEWYSKYSDWSMTNYSETNDNMFWFYITPATEVFDTDHEVTETVAQWGGASQYTEEQMAISADRFVIGDQKNTESEYTAVASGNKVKPFTKVTSSATGSTSYYMGGTGLGSGTDDYMQFVVSTKGWGDMNLSFRLRSSGTGAGEWKLQYSTDGTAFKDVKTGSYTCSYTKYDSSGSNPTSVTLADKISDGIAKTSICSGTYINFNFDLPDGAENADKLYIRMIPSNTQAKDPTKATSSSGTVRIDTVVITGSPIVNEKIAGYVSVTPDGVEEDVAAGTELTFTTATVDATILYRFMDMNGAGNEEWLTYDETKKPVLPQTLPIILQVKATKAGISESVTRMFHYAAGTVSNVKITPNGGGIYIKGQEDSQIVMLSCDTKDATIYYNTGKKDELDNYVYQVYDPATTEIKLEKGFKSFEIRAYAVKGGLTDGPVTTRTFTERENESYGIYFGQMHSHTTYSDGAGSAKDAYEHGSKVKNLDFLAVTDHSNSFDNADQSVLSEDASKISTEWAEGKELAKQYTTEKFVGLFGYEMTWSNGLGHMNTFNTPGFQSRTQSAYSTYSTALQNYYATLKTVGDGISQFNHPGTTFGDFSDFAYYDEEIDQLITLVEVGNGEGAIGSSGYFPSYEYYTRALDKGWHVAPTNNQDNHKGLWGDANTGRSVVLTDSLDEKSIYDAMRNYRVYATEDNDLSVYYTLDGNIMGTILSKEDVDNTVTLQAKVSDPTDSNIGKVEVIVNGGLSIATKNVDSSDATVTFCVPNNYSYYYLKITQSDGDIAVTAPVWVGKVEAVGISDFSTKTILAVKNQSVDLNATIFNNEKKPFNISKIEFLVNDKIIKTMTEDELKSAGMDSVAKLSTASYRFDYTYKNVGAATYEIIVTGTLNGVEKQYKEKLKLSYIPEEMVTNVVVDGTHYNDYVTGYYGGNMGNFAAIGAAESVKVTVAGQDKDAKDRSLTENEWKSLLSECSLLIVSAPARANGTANSGEYHASEFEDWFIQLVADYVKNGGNVIVCGLADYQDKNASKQTSHAAAQLNKLLSAIGSTMSVNDDEVYDEINNGGQAYRLYPNKFNQDSKWTKGIVTIEQNPENYQKYSQYSGCSVNSGNGEALVIGFDTTYSIDSDKDSVGNIKEGETITNQVISKGNVSFLAAEETSYGGTIFAAGGVFVSDFEIDEQKDNALQLPYANTTIAKNILQEIKTELPYTDISKVRAAANAGKLGEIYRIKGRVTSGNEIAGNAFFDTIYLQDDTAGITIFPYAEPGLKLGTEMEIIGYIDEYQGDSELQIISSKILDDKNLKVIEPKELPCAKASDYANYGGLLTKVTGTVKKDSIYYNSDGTLAQFVVEDSTGEATVFIDGYILSQQTGKNTLKSIVREGAKVSAVGLQYMHPESFIKGVNENVSVLRVRNCDEIVLVNDSTSYDDDSSNNTKKPEEQKPVEKTVKTKITIDKKTKATIVVTTDKNGKVTSTATVTTQGNQKKNGTNVVISKKTLDKIKEIAGTKNVAITQKVTNEKGKTVYTIKFNTSDLKTGEKLTVVKQDRKSGTNVFVTNKNIVVNKNGSISITLDKTGIYTLLDSKASKEMEKSVLESIKIAKKTVTLKVGQKKNVKLSSLLNTENVSKITYSSTKKSVATIDKKGIVIAKKKGTTTIKVTVYLKNGSKKTVTEKIVVK